MRDAWFRVWILCEAPELPSLEDMKERIFIETTTRQIPLNVFSVDAVPAGIGPALWPCPGVQVILVVGCHITRKAHLRRSTPLTVYPGRVITGPAKLVLLQLGMTGARARLSTTNAVHVTGVTE